MEETSKNNETAKLGIDAVSSHTFEYRVIDHDMFDEDEIQTMNSMGSKGWEIIRILEPMEWLNSDGMFVRIYYKRPSGLPFCGDRKHKCLTLIQ